MFSLITSLDKSFDLLDKSICMKKYLLKFKKLNLRLRKIAKKEKKFLIESKFARVIFLGTFLHTEKITRV